jgi:CubicO group peptidase (beta-lactamase class C family)
VVDLWGGEADVATGRPYDEHTLQLVFSTSKGVTSICALMLAERGLLDFDAPVAKYWPEFAANGKDAITVRMLMSHTAGLAAIDEPLTIDEFLQWDPVVERLAAQPPNWPPGTARGYHSLTFGHLVGEVIRRASGDTVGAWVQRELAKPLGLDLWIGLPEQEEPRVAPLIDFPPSDELSEFLTAVITPGTMTHRSFMNPPIAVTWFNERPYRECELPAVNGITNARSLARLYAACIGTVDGVRVLTDATVEEARSEQSRGPDLVLIDRDEVANGLGFFLPDALSPMAGPGSFGHQGLGGSLGCASPELELAFGYVMNQCLDSSDVDVRTDNLIRAAIDCIHRT